jgi:hypothetical protein
LRILKLAKVPKSPKVPKVSASLVRPSFLIVNGDSRAARRADSPVGKTGRSAKVSSKKFGQLLGLRKL